MLGVVVLVGALALTGWLVARFLRGVRRDPGGEVAVTGDVGRSAEDWLADAERHERAGRLREAVRCRYRALVAALAERGVVEEIPGRTTGEYLAEVRAAAPTGGDAFAAVTAAFEEAWYGAGEVTAGAVERLALDSRRVREAARPGDFGQGRAPVGAGTGGHVR